MEGALKMMAPIRIYEPKTMAKGKNKSIPPCVKMTSSLREVSEQLSFRSTVRSQKKWVTVLLAQKDSRTKRSVCNRATLQEMIQEAATNSTHRPSLMMVV